MPSRRHKKACLKAKNSSTNAEEVSNFKAIKKMMSKFTSIAFAATILVSPLVQADPPNWNSVNVMAFDVASVKLGMGYEQALEALANHFKIRQTEQNAIRKSTQTPYNSITKNKQPLYLSYTTAQASIELTFSTRIPVSSSNPVAVSRISYGITNTKENNALVKEMALSKYGPSSDSRDINMLKWCEHFVPGPQCDIHEPKLEMSFGSVILIDPRFEEAVQAYELSLRQTKPNF